MNPANTIRDTQGYEKTTIDSNVEISRISVAFITLTASLIGCWALASLFAGTISSGGPVQLIQNLFTAITG